MLTRKRIAELRAEAERLQPESDISKALAMADGFARVIDLVDERYSFASVGVEITRIVRVYRAAEAKRKGGG